MTTLTAKIRTRHHPNPTAIHVNGIPIPSCQSCWAPYPCDAIQLCDILDNTVHELSDTQVAKTARLRALPTRDEIADEIYRVLDPQYGYYNDPIEAADNILTLLTKRQLD